MPASKLLSFVFLRIALVSVSETQTNERPQRVVLTEIGGDPVDQQSMIRLTFNPQPKKDNRDLSNPLNRSII